MSTKKIVFRSKIVVSKLFMQSDEFNEYLQKEIETVSKFVKSEDYFIEVNGPVRDGESFVNDCFIFTITLKS